MVGYAVTVVQAVAVEVVVTGLIPNRNLSKILTGNGLAEKLIVPTQDAKGKNSTHYCSESEDRNARLYQPSQSNFPRGRRLEAGLSQMLPVVAWRFNHRCVNWTNPSKPLYFVVH